MHQEINGAKKKKDILKNIQQITSKKNKTVQETLSVSKRSMTEILKQQYFN